MKKFYNKSTMILQHDTADSVVIKGINKASIEYTIVNGSVTINTQTYTPGIYYLQYFLNDDIIEQEQIEIKQNLKYASANYDPRSNNEKALEAIKAFIEGRATPSQRRIKVGDKEIEYSSYEQLMKWKSYFEEQLRKEKGLKNIRFEKVKFGGF